MILLILFFFTVLYPYLLYVYLYNYTFNKNNVVCYNIFDDNQQENFNIYITKSIDLIVNPFSTSNYELSVSFDIPLNIDHKYIINNEQLISKNYEIHEVVGGLNHITFALENENLNEIFKFIEYLYPTYSQVTFVYYEKNPFINILIKNNIEKINYDTTRNYFMINAYILLLQINPQIHISDDIFVNIIDENSILKSKYLSFVDMAHSKCLKIKNIYQELI